MIIASAKLGLNSMDQIDKIDQLINECENDVKYQTTLKTLLSQLNQAKQRQDILEYKHLYRQLLNKEQDVNFGNFSWPHL